MTQKKEKARDDTGMMKGCDDARQGRKIAYLSVGRRRTDIHRQYSQ